MNYIETDKTNLINSSLKMVTELLAIQDEFYPLAFVADLNGHIENITYFDGNDIPGSEELMVKFLDIFEEKADQGELRSCALAYDVRVKRDSESNTLDAIAIKIFHVEKPEIISYFYSYKKSGNGGIELLESWNDSAK